MGASKKIVVGFTFILILIGTLGFFSLKSLQNNEAVNEDVISHLFSDMLLDESVREHVSWAADLSQAVVGTIQFSSSFKPEACDFTARLERLRLDDPSASLIISNLRESHSVLTQKILEAKDLLLKGLKTEAAGVFTSQVAPNMEKFEADYEELARISNLEVDKAMKAETVRTKQTESFLLIIAALAFLISAAVAIFVYLAIRRVANQLATATNQITSSSNEILATSQEQASGAREQSSAVSETTSAAKELSATSEVVGESIKKVSQVAAHAMAGMAKIKEAIDKTNRMLTSLGEKSQRIGRITELIDDVADQTNLLAVNASIEAARAGEQGRGFTVVADEIRKLADSTAKSTRDITSLIELIQHEISNAIVSMEQSVTSVDEEARLAQQTTEKAKEIAMSANQQISGSKQIADAMLNIDEAMKQIAAGASQSQTAARQLMELATELKDMMTLLK